MHFSSLPFPLDGSGPEETVGIRLKSGELPIEGSARASDDFIHTSSVQFSQTPVRSASTDGEKDTSHLD